MTGLALVALGLLPGFGPVALVGRVIIGVGAVLHVLAGVGYLRGMLAVPINSPGRWSLGGR